MSRRVTIDFENTIGFDALSKDLKTANFKTMLEDGNPVNLKIEISNEEHELMPNMYNLAFGPIDVKGKIDDRAQLTHKDYSAVFSTILLAALGYLNKNQGHSIGVDGSNNSRAYLYWRYLQHNYEYLSHYFEFFGIKYYVRISRFGKLQYDNPFDFADIIPASIPIYKTDQWPEPMFNYFIFGLKQR